MSAQQAVTDDSYFLQPKVGKKQQKNISSFLLISGANKVTLYFNVIFCSFCQLSVALFYVRDGKEFLMATCSSLRITL